MNFQRSTLRVYPVPDDENQTWLAMDRLSQQLRGDNRFAEFQRADQALFAALAAGGADKISRSSSPPTRLNRSFGI